MFLRTTPWVERGKKKRKEEKKYKLKA